MRMLADIVVRKVPAAGPIHLPAHVPSFPVADATTLATPAVATEAEVDIIMTDVVAIASSVVVASPAAKVHSPEAIVSQ